MLAIISDAMSRLTKHKLLARIAEWCVSVLVNVLHACVCLCVCVANAIRTACRAPTSLVFQPDSMIKFSNDGQAALRGQFEVNGFNELPHLQMLLLVEEFAVVLRCQDLNLPSVLQDLPDGTSPAVPFEQFHALLSIISFTTTLAMISAAINEKLILPHVAEPQIEIQDVELFTSVATLVWFHGHVVLKLHDFLQSAICKKVEETCTTLICPIVTYQSWAASMGMFGGKAQDFLLQHISRKVLRQVQTLASACPDMKACCCDGDGEDGVQEFDHELAISICANKYAAVELLYNRLRTTMQDAAKVAAKLQLVPSIDKHPNTREAMARASSVLDDAYHCLVFIDGVEMLRKYGNHADGPATAKTFLSTHRTKCPRIPQAFWCAVEMLSKSAATTTTAAEVKAARATEHVAVVKRCLPQIKLEPVPQDMARKARRVKVE